MKNHPSASGTQPFFKRPATLWAALAVPLSCLSLTGCFSMGGELVASKPIVANRPGSALVVSGSQIRQGDSKEAVRIAWGTPSETTVNHTPRGPQECWTYVQTYHGHGGGYFGLPRGWEHGKKGKRYNSDSYYPAPHSAQTLGGTPSTDVPVKRVIFENDRVASYETRHQHAHEG